MAQLCAHKLWNLDEIYVPTIDPCRNRMSNKLNSIEQIQIVYQDTSPQKAQGKTVSQGILANFQKLDFPNTPMFQNMGWVMWRSAYSPKYLFNLALWSILTTTVWAQILKIFCLDSPFLLPLIFPTSWCWGVTFLKKKIWPHISAK